MLQLAFTPQEPSPWPATRSRVISPLPEPSPHPDPLPSHPMGAEREQQLDDAGHLEIGRQSQVPGFNARSSDAKHNKNFYGASWKRYSPAPTTHFIEEPPSETESTPGSLI